MPGHEPILPGSPGWRVEAERQGALLTAIHYRQTDLPPGWHSPAGAAGARPSLQAYQGQAGATALRALAAVFPVLAQVVGDAGFAMLAHGLWQSAPPLRGDLACWGADLAALIGSRRELDEVPYLADLARLEWQIHGTLRAGDGAAGLDSLHVLGEHDPEQLGLRFQPGCALLRSAYPVATIWEVHQADGPAADASGAEDRLAPARRALALGLGENVWIHRRGWRLALTRLSPAEADLSADLLAGASLGSALQRCDPALFEPWLRRAVQQDWLAAVHRIEDDPPMSGCYP